MQHDPTERMQFASREYRLFHPLHLLLLLLLVIVLPRQKAQLVQCVLLHGRNLAQTRLESHTLQQGLHGRCESAAHLMGPHHLHSADGWQPCQQQWLPLPQAQHAHHKKAKIYQLLSAREKMERRVKIAMTTQQLH